MPGYYGSAVYGSAAYGPGADQVATLEQLKRHLRVTGAASDEHLADVLDVALDLAELHTGSIIAPRLIQQTADGGQCAILLTNLPVQSVEAVTESGTTLTAADWVADLSAGILYRGTSTSSAAWACGRQNIVIVTVAGPATVAPTARQAILEIARHLWDTQRGGSQLPRQAGAGDDWDPRAGYSIPRLAAELLDGHRQAGIA